MKFEIYSEAKCRDVKINGDTWCRLEAVANECRYTFFPSNVPSEYGVAAGEGEIEGKILCGTQEIAMKCLEAIAELIENGYSEPMRWLVALDMGDIMAYVFNGSTMQYLHCGNISEKTAESAKLPNGTAVMFASFCLTAEEKSASFCETFLEQICPDSCESVWWQLSACEYGAEAVDIWYR